ncbi:cation diffusion facilitator family transporter [Ruegeria sp. 2012CJ41-6]|uniref:Cation diffusion facilitator family transporter n=1 Tax=Ruegeria spongiae TaxID=2942209 RepID=A0ABT0Q5E4_9RHOB|nr:cation diffusion facilitator family transporter [Ruegeria spongiae]MCL6285089.1 cation diffusion facilitator family transporter [Ruegeria spongiae]
MAHHDHSAAGHHHHHAANEKKVARAAVLTGLFMVVELVGGLISGSLALIADAGHMLTDFGAMILAWSAFRLARRPADWKRTYGFDRFSVLAAFVNGLMLFLVAIWICWEAWGRLSDPAPVMGKVMMWVALAGLAVNIAVFVILTRGGGENLNIRAAVLHVIGDLLGSVAALIASIVIIYTGWTPIDPILSVFVALIILRAAWAVVRDSAHILLEGAPVGFDRDAVTHQLQDEVPGVSKVGHFHAWSITQERSMATLELTVDPATDAQDVKTRVKTWLSEQHGITHVTIELCR